MTSSCNRSSLPRTETYNNGLQIYNVKEQDKKTVKRWLDFIRLHTGCVNGKNIYIGKKNKHFLLNLSSRGRPMRIVRYQKLKKRRKPSVSLSSTFSSCCRDGLLFHTHHLTLRLLSCYISKTVRFHLWRPLLLSLWLDWDLQGDVCDANNSFMQNLTLKH